MKVFLAVANFDKLYVNYTITKENGETESNTIVSDTNIIDLPYYENATYTLEYWAENRYQKTRKYTWGFTTIAQIQEPPPNIRATPTAGNTAVYVSWDNTAKGYTVHMLRRVDDGYTYETYATEHNYFVYTTKQPIEYVQFAVSCGIGPNKFISTYTNELKVSAIPTKPGDVQSLNITVPSVSYTTEYIHTSKSIRFHLTVTHSQGDVVLGTFLVLTDNAGKQWILTVYKGTTNETSSNAAFEIPWVYSNSQTFTLKAYPITTIGTIEEKVATVSIPLSKYSVTPPTPSLGDLISGGFDTVYVPWGAVSHPAPIVYELQYDTNSSFTAPTTITTTNAGYTVQFNFTSDTTVYFRIRAVDNWGNASSYSTVKSAVVKSYSSWNNALTQQLNGLSNAVNNVEYYARQITFELNNFFEDVQGNPSAAGWNTFVGNWSIVGVSDGIAGKYAAQNTANTVAWAHSNKIPIDVNKQYIVECYARTISGTSGVFYLAVVLFDANGNIIAGDGTWWYYPVLSIVPPTTWTYYNGLFGANTNKPFPSNAKYMAVGFILNYDGGNRIMQVQSPYIREVFDGVYIRNGAIKDAHIESLNGNKIMAKTIKSNHIDVTKLQSIAADLGVITAGQLLSSDGKVDFNLNSKQLIIKDSNGNPILKAGQGVLEENGTATDGVYIGPKALISAERSTITTLNASTINILDGTNLSLRLTSNTISSNSNIIIKPSNAAAYTFSSTQLTLPDNTLNGRGLMDNSVQPSKMSQFSISASAFNYPSSLSLSITDSYISNNTSQAIYGRCSVTSIGIDYYRTDKYWATIDYVIDSSRYSPSVSYNNGTITVSITTQPPQNSYNGTLQGFYAYQIQKYLPYPCEDISYEHIQANVSLQNPSLMDYSISYTCTVTIGGFATNTAYQITPKNGAQVYNPSTSAWTTSTIIVNNVSSIQVRQNITSTSDTIQIEVRQSNGSAFSFNQVPVIGAKFHSASTSINLSTFCYYYNPWTQQGYSDTLGTSGTSGWRWIPNLPLNVEYFTIGQPGTFAWAWDLAASFGKPVNVNIAVQGVDDQLYIFVYNGSWLTLVTIGSYDQNWNIRTYSASNVYGILAVGKDTTGEGFFFFTIGIAS